ncbi:acyl-CoA thioesterase [Leptotrichia sp. OH3620_COT-345]|uniref:acyl-CoA thioesterase n=1 Tax=Leptotrichia sp. OH3620_COT-345 TaxID=2491048 RepID=UPI000F64D03E|nr:thioesterase family protein [Leptotrichia sp. OH3620_COT-345]RRD39483.1 acyl-CoA thioesterase [Leptotrichia sp. OH3620_COT-345]
MKKSFNVRTYYYDTDHMGVVYHANYLKWMEIARTEYFRDVLPYKEIEDMGIMMPVKSLNIEYINSIGYDEDVEIIIELKEITSIKIRFFYEIYGKDKVLKATAETLNVTIDREGKLKRLPKDILNILKG